MFEGDEVCIIRSWERVNVSPGLLLMGVSVCGGGGGT